MKRILLIDDEAGIRLIVPRLHETMEPTFRGQCTMDVATDLEQGLQMISMTEYDAIILDLNLPPLTRDQVISFIFERSNSPVEKPFPPIIVLTGTEDIYVRRRCIIGGAAGFWVKPDMMSHPNLFFKELYNEYLKRYAATQGTAAV